MMLSLLWLLMSMQTQAAKPQPVEAKTSMTKMGATAAMSSLSMSGWPTEKIAYVKMRAADPSLKTNVQAAERATRVVLSPQVRDSLAAEYAAAEYEAIKLDYPLVPVATQEQKVLTDYLAKEISAGETEPVGFRFETKLARTTLFARIDAPYGKLKVTLNPPVDTFTVTVGENIYDSPKVPIVLLANDYDVVVDRTTDKCKGKVKIQDRRTTLFPCR